MNRSLLPVCLLAACGLAVVACQPKPTERKPGNDYQAPAAQVAPPANLSSVCYNDADLSAFRVRQVQQQLVVGVLQCKGPNGKMLLDKQYGLFIQKYNPELASNASEMKSLTGRKKANLDVMVTEIANRTAQKPTTDPDFCSRHRRALEWALLEQTTSLTQVPAPYELGPDMKVFACPKG